MCDYSLNGLRSRLAVQGEDLVVHRFPTHSIGLASSSDLQRQTAHQQALKQNLWQRLKNFFQTPNLSDVPAVCIPPGACLILQNIPDGLQRRWNVRKEEVVSFVQIGMEANTYRDAILFNNGRRILLQDMAEGMPVQVISLGGGLAFAQEPAFAIPSRPAA